MRLALALTTTGGAFAALLGSGLSAASGVPTGRQIVADLITRLATLDGATIGGDPLAWYRQRFGEEPDYSRLLDAVARSPTERSALLRGYIEPTDSVRRLGRKIPGAAHHALARLAARGHISVFLTTNFDRLLEQALDAAGVAPMTISSPDDLEGAVPLGRARCMVVKLHGDYLDTRIKNTPAELDAYHPSIDRLLDRVLDEYGLLVCGWSADWDTALRRAFERCPTRRYSTFWASRSAPTGAAAALVALRQAEVIRISDADSFLSDLVTKVTALEAGAATPVAAPGPSRRDTTLPSRPASFVGRRRELGEVRDYLANARLLTLLGPGGTGKTALAVEVVREAAARFEEGATFVDLANARTEDAVVTAVTRAVGLGTTTEGTMKSALIDHLRPQQRLLVLDNFEQVIAAAGVVAELLAACPRLSVLVTSRAALRLRGEQTYEVPPLTLPPADAAIQTPEDAAGYEAIQLFVERSAAVRPGFALTEGNAATIAEICRRLDGLPLAIELAASRLRLLSLEALRNQLGDRLGLLRMGPRDLPERQQALRATIEWSYDLLDSDERRLLRLLAVFAEADIAAIEAVAGATGGMEAASGDVIDALLSLAEKSLIRRRELPDGSVRIGMLETIREFAAEQLLRHADDAERAWRAHARYYADMLRRLQPELYGSGQSAALAAMALDVDNLSQAWRFWVAARDIDQHDKMADGLLLLNEQRGWPRETVGLASDMLEVLAAAPSVSQGSSREITLRTTLARALMTTKGFTPDVEAALSKNLQLSENGAVATEQYFSVLRGLVNHYNFRGDVAMGARIGARMIELAAHENDPATQIEGQLLVGVGQMFNGDLKGGLDVLDGATALFASVGPHAFRARMGGPDPRVACHTTSAITLWLLGSVDDAVGRADAALELAAGLEHPLTMAFASFHAGLLHLWLRDFGAADEQVARLLDLAAAHDFGIWQAAGTILRGAVRVGQTGANEALVELRNGLDTYQGLRTPPIFWPMLLAMHATACHGAGRAAEGLPPVEAAFELAGRGLGSTMLPEYRILKGDLLAAMANGTAAGEPEEWYRLAFDSSQAIGARLSSLKAATRLCRIAPDEARHADARRFLAESCSTWARTGDFPDLRDAREVLGG